MHLSDCCLLKFIQASPAWEKKKKKKIRCVARMNCSVLTELLAGSVKTKFLSCCVEPYLARLSRHLCCAYRSGIRVLRLRK